MVQERGSSTQDLVEEGDGRKMQTKSQRDSEKLESDKESSEISSGEECIPSQAENEREKSKLKKECESEKEVECKNVISVEKREKSKNEIESDVKFGKEKAGTKTQLEKNEKRENPENDSSEMSIEKEIETLKSEDDYQIKFETKEKESIKDTGEQSERKRRKRSKRKSKSRRKNQVEDGKKLDGKGMSESISEDKKGEKVESEEEIDSKKYEMQRSASEKQEKQGIEGLPQKSTKVEKESDEECRKKRRCNRSKRKKNESENAASATKKEKDELESCREEEEMNEKENEEKSTAMLEKDKGTVQEEESNEERENVQSQRETRGITSKSKDKASQYQKDKDRKRSGTQTKENTKREDKGIVEEEISSDEEVRLKPSHYSQISNDESEYESESSEESTYSGSGVTSENLQSTGKDEIITKREEKHRKQQIENQRKQIEKEQISQHKPTHSTRKSKDSVSPRKGTETQSERGNDTTRENRDERKRKRDRRTESAENKPIIAEDSNEDEEIESASNGEKETKSDNEYFTATSEKEEECAVPYREENETKEKHDTSRKSRSEAAGVTPSQRDNQSTHYDTSKRDVKQNVKPKKKSKNKQKERSRDHEDSSSPLVSPKESQPPPRGRKNRERRENVPGSSATDVSSPESDVSDVSRTLTQSETNALLKMFDRYFGKLCCALKEPVETAAQLQSQHLLSISVMEDLLVSPESKPSKAITLVRALQERIKSRTDRIFSIIKVCIQSAILKEIGREMMTETERICPDRADDVLGREPQTQHDLHPPPPSDDRTSPAVHLQSEPQTSANESKVHSKQPTTTTRDSESSEVVIGSVSVVLELSPELTKYRQYLQSVYRARKLAAADKYLPTLDSPYINLAMINRGSRFEGDRDEFTRQTLHGGVDQILADKTPINIEDLLVPSKTGEAMTHSYVVHGGARRMDQHRKKKNKKPKPVRFVLVEGPPGIGKSTFCWELCRRWNELESLRKFLIILLLKLREKWVLKATSFAELFRFPPDPELSRRIAQLLHDSNGRNLLLILDGFDEVSHSFHEDSVIKSILCRELLPECTIILTTRPSAMTTLRSICQPQVDKHVEIIGFTEEERVRFITEVFSMEPELQANFLKYMFLVPHIKSMMYIPLNCATIAQVYYESQSSRHLAIPKTRTQLYKALTHSLLVRHMKTKEDSREYTCMLPEGLNKEDMERFRVLAKFAFYSYHNEGTSKDTSRKVTFEAEFAFESYHMEGIERKVTFFSEDIPKALVHYGMMNESSEMYAGKGVEKTFSFLHLSLQEYLAAWHLAHSFSTEFQVYYHKMASQPFDQRMHRTPPHAAFHQPTMVSAHDLTSSLISPPMQQHQSFLHPHFNPQPQAPKHQRQKHKEKAMIQSLESLGDSLVEPAVFLAGITGWRCQSDDDRNLWETYLSHDTAYVDDTNLLLRSLYEAQNPILLSHYFMNEDRRNITIGSDWIVRSTQTPYDCYALSYCLSHSSDQFSLSVGIERDSDVSLVETFVKGVDDHCKSTTPAVRSLKVDLRTKSVESIKRCLFWLSKVKFSGEVEGMEFAYIVRELPFSQQFLQSLYNLKSLTISTSQRTSKWEDRNKITLEWLPALRSLTELEVLKINFSNDECILPSTGFDCLPVEYKLREVVLNTKLPSNTIYDLNSPTDVMIGSLLKLAAKSYHNLTKTELPLKSISRENMAGVRSILLHCPSLESLELKETRLGYDGILFICSAVRFNTTLKHLLIHDDPQLPPLPPYLRTRVTFKSKKRVPLPINNIYALPDKTTCTDFLLELDNILKNNTTLKHINIQSGLFLPLSDGNVEYSQWTGLGPLQQYNMGAVASGRSPNLRRSFSSSDLTQPQNTLFWYRYDCSDCDIGEREIDFNKLFFIRREKGTKLCSVPSFTAPDTQVLQSFSGLDPRLQECLEISDLHEYVEYLRETYNELLEMLERESNLTSLQQYRMQSGKSF